MYAVLYVQFNFMNIHVYTLQKKVIFFYSATKSILHSLSIKVGKNSELLIQGIMYSLCFFDVLYPNEISLYCMFRGILLLLLFLLLASHHIFRYTVKIHLIIYFCNRLLSLAAELRVKF